MEPLAPFHKFLREALHVARQCLGAHPAGIRVRGSRSSPDYQTPANLVVFLVLVGMYHLWRGTPPYQ